LERHRNPLSDPGVGDRSFRLDVARPLRPWAWGAAISSLRSAPIVVQQFGAPFDGRDVDKNLAAKIHCRMMGGVFAEPEYLFKRFVIMPCRHNKSVAGYVTIFKLVKIGVIDAIVPKATIWPPSHHIKTPTFY